MNEERRNEQRQNDSDTANVRESRGKNGAKDQLLTTDGRLHRVPFPPLYDTTCDMT